MGFVLETTDADVAFATLGNFYNVRTVSVPEPTLSVSLRQDQVGPIGLHHLHLGMHCRVGGDPLGPLRLVHLVRGTMTYHRRRESTEYGPNDLYLSTQPDVPIEADVSCADMDITVLDAGLLSQVADRAPDRPLEPIHLTGYEPWTPSHAARWLTTYRYVHETLSTPLAGDQPLLIGAAARLLAAAALSTFPNTAAKEDSRMDRHDAHSETLRRAIAFIDENSQRDISIGDIAAGSYASVRSVQLAFRRQLDTTPLRYLRQVRLDHVHHQLADADPSQQSVAEIAHQWGFSNLSRFARSYRAIYGVLPSRTLREG